MAITKVAYYSNSGVLIAERTQAPFDFIKWEDVPEGTYELTAKVWVDGVEQATSQVVNISAIPKYSNLIIGDPLNSIPDAATLSNKLGIYESQVQNFIRVGDKMQAFIRAKNIELGDSAFRGLGLTSFEDLEGRITKTYPGSAWRDNTELILAYLPAIEYYTVAEDYNANFLNCHTDLVIYANIAASTCNGGSPDPDLVNDGYSVVYIQNETAPLAITDLSTGTIYGTAIQLNFTPPSATNTIIEYHVYNGTTRLGTITNPGDYISDLDPDTTYSDIRVFAVDQYYNVGAASNSVSESTIIPQVQTLGLFDSWNFDGATGNVPGYNGNNGTISGTVTRDVAPLISSGKSFDFGGGEVRVPHSEGLWLNNAGNNRDIAFNFWIKFNSLPDPFFIFNKKGPNGAADEEFNFVYNSTIDAVRFNIKNTDGTNAYAEFPTPSLGTKYMWSAKTDVANDLIKLFVNGKIINISATGTFKTINTTLFDLVFGRAGWDSSFGRGDFVMDEPRIWIDNVPEDIYFEDEYNNGNGITL